MNDLAADPEYRPVMRRLWNKLIELQTQLADPLDLSESFPELAKR